MSFQEKEFHCPLCNFVDESEYALELHFEAIHPVGNDPLPQQHQSGSSSLDPQLEDDSLRSKKDSKLEKYAECLDPNCGESVLEIDLPSHMDMHLAERMTFEDDEPRPSRSKQSSRETQVRSSRSDARRQAPRGLWRTSNQSKSSRSREHSPVRHSGLRSFRGLFSGSSKSGQKTPAGSDSQTKRLGKAQLGPFAYEERMPDWLFKQLDRGGKITTHNRIGMDGKIEKIIRISNETSETLLVVARLCQLDLEVDQTVMCHPGVVHISKMSKEGSFCGYRNIQMMVSYLQSSQTEGHEHFRGRLPSVLEIQDLIERAWDQGINATSRVETGGIKGTRKYIGTPEAQAMFLGLKIDCEIRAFVSTPQAPAYEKVFDVVEEYFRSGCSNLEGKICKTWLPPLYFQYPGHSLTIVGIERRAGTRNLLVFDPSFMPPKGVRDHVGRMDFHVRNPEKILAMYRKTPGFLKKYQEFEILQLTHSVEKLGGKVWAKTVQRE